MHQVLAAFSCLKLARMETMTDEQFWSMVERSRAAAKDCDEQAEKLRALVRELETPLVVEFCLHWDDKMCQLDRPDVFAVATIINYGCSDDGFSDFCGWVIAHGRAFFEAAVEKPERIAEGIPPGEEGQEVECEEILYCGNTIYRERTGKYPSEVEWPSDPSRFCVPGPGYLADSWRGESWREEDWPRLFPELCARFH